MGGRNSVIVLKWVWQERSIVDTAHPAMMLFVDIVRSGQKANLEGATVLNAGG